MSSAPARDGGLLEALPWAAAAAGLGAAAVESPTLALGAGATGVLAVLPWAALFAALAIVSLIQRWTYTVAGLTFRPDELVAAVFAARALTAQERFRLAWPEWTLITFLGVQVATSALHSVDLNASLHVIALLAFGAMAYLATYTTAFTRERLILGVRVFLGTLAVAAGIGVIGLVSYYAAGAVWGITRLDTLRGFPAALGLAYEHDIFGSTCAAGVIAFYLLWREPNPAFTRVQSVVGFWLCATGTVLSLARGAWIALAAGAVALYLANRLGGRVVRGRLVSLISVGVVGVGLAVVLFFGTQAGQQATQVGSSTAGALGQQAGNVLNFGGSTGAHRFHNWKTALSQVKSAPLLGLGTNSFGQRNFEETAYGSIPAFLGNWAIRTLYDSGLIGLGLLVAFLCAVAWPGPRVRASGGELGPVVQALVFAALVLGVAYLATDAMLLVWPWVLLGLTRSARVIARAEASATGQHAKARAETGAS